MLGGALNSDMVRRIVLAPTLTSGKFSRVPPLAVRLVQGHGRALLMVRSTITQTHITIKYEPILASGGHELDRASVHTAWRHRCGECTRRLICGAHVWRLGAEAVGVGVGEGVSALIARITSKS